MKFNEYLGKHLAEYIKHELNAGYPINSIRRVLILKGHHKTVVDDVIGELKKKNFRPYVVKHKQHGKLSEDAFNYTVNLVEKYIDHQLKTGYDINEIKEILVNYGHSYEVIDSALKKIRKYKEHGKVERKGKETLILCVIGLIVALFAISVMVDEPIYLIILGFLPAIISLVAVEMLKKEKAYMLVAPFVITALYFLIIVATNLPPLANMDSVQLAVLNLILSYVFAALYYTENL